MGGIGGTLFWENIEKLQKENGFTVRWLADQVGERENTLSMMKKRGTLPRVDIALNMANALKTPLEYLVTGEMPDPTRGLPQMTRFMARLIDAMSDPGKAEVLAFIISRIPPDEYNEIRTEMEMDDIA